MTDKISLKELTSSSNSWSIYDSKVTPIEYAKNPKRDMRVYLLVVLNDNEGLLFNKAGKRIGTMVGDEVAEFYDENEHFLIQTKVPTYAPDNNNEYGVGHFYNESKGEMK